MNYYCNLSLYFLGYFTFHLSSQYSIFAFIFAFICRTDDEWIMYVVCKGSDEGEEFVKAYRIDKSEITLGNLTTMKSKLGYGSRDYMYYKQRSADDPAAATLNDIDYDVDALRMIDSNEAERELRLLLSKNPVADRCVAITPIKSKRVCSDHYEEEEVEESELDAYKDWLAYMHTRNQAMGEL
jgi:hypothetical protein